MITKLLAIMPIISSDKSKPCYCESISHYHITEIAN